VRGWHERHKDQGLVVIGIHYPEFPYEADLGNLIAAVDRLDVPYAVVQDNQGLAWSAYHVRYWPTLVLIDKHGHIRFQHIGEGRYEEIEQAIQFLLEEAY
jgi:hypothetical protein